MTTPTKLSALVRLIITLQSVDSSPQRLTLYLCRLSLVHLHQHFTLPHSNTVESFQTHDQGAGPNQRVHQVSMLTLDQLCSS